jgi:hypothetical protein
MIALLLLLVQEPAREDLDFFESRIRPVLIEHCYSCHSADAKKLKGGLRLDTRAGVLQGGDNGAILVPGNPKKSPLMASLRWESEDVKMPPKKRLPEEVVRDFEDWIRRGAPDPRGGEAHAAPAKPKIDIEAGRRWWAFQPVRAAAGPGVRDASWPLDEIDRFILARLESRGLKPNPDVARRDWIRRVTFDLSGLPPTPEETEAFLADASPEAHAKVVDRLLASPRYGERWGRHWLDVVRYADTAGDNSDFPVPQLVRYRDYVVDAFNADKPYDVFVKEQIAGDLMPAADEAQRHERLIATGYLAGARRFGSRVDDYPWHLTIEDTLDNLGRTFMAFTINCTRCHDHKFDPFTNEDYYALYGFFSSTRYPWPGIELQQHQRDLVSLAPPGVAEREAEAREAGRRELAAAVKALEAAKKKAADDKEESARLGKELDGARKRLKDFDKRPLPYPTAYAVAEASRPGNARVQIKGDPSRLGAEVPRRFPAVLGGRTLPADAKGSGRLQLAEWIVDPSNPLAARVMVNRLWHHHFGRGIVATPSDFGRQGRAPTHPELLDHLATRFMDAGWSVKALHRAICLSRSYRVSVDETPELVRDDPANELFGRYPRRRLDAESIRDALLAVGGGLDLDRGGPHPFPPSTEWGFTQHKPFLDVYDHRRRSIYLMTQRIRRHPFFGLFDGADPSASTSARITSTTTLQALYFLNDPFVHEQARLLAERTAAGASTEEARLDLAWRLALNRPPTDEEAAGARRHLARMRATSGDAQAWESLARVIFRMNEFVYLR